MTDSRRKVLWAFGILAVACPCSICGLGYLLLRSWFAGPAQDLPNQLSRAHQEGLPLDPKDLRPNPPIPENQNAASIYRSCFPRIHHQFDQDPKLKQKIDLSKDSPAQVADVRRAVAAQRETLDRIIEATRRPYCDFRYRYEKGFDLLFPEFVDAKRTAQMLIARAQLEALDGHAQEAFATIAATRKLGTHIGQTPVLIGGLVNLSLERIAATGFDRCLVTFRSNPTALRTAQSSLADDLPLLDLRRSFRGEVVLGLIGIRSVRSLGDLRQTMGSQNDSVSSGGSSLNIPDTVRDAFLSHFVAEWRRIFADLPRDPANWQQAEAVLRRVDQEIESDHTISNTMNAIVFPVFDQAATAVGRQQADRNMSVTAVRLMLNRLKARSYPEKLPSYGPTSVDPFDGKPLRYRPKGDGFILYSIGPDRKDDGGVLPKGGREGDVVRSF